MAYSESYFDTLAPRVNVDQNGHLASDFRITLLTQHSVLYLYNERSGRSYGPSTSLDAHGGGTG
jgi:hypothetical protein